MESWELTSYSCREDSGTNLEESGASLRGVGDTGDEARAYSLCLLFSAYLSLRPSLSLR